MNYPKANLKTEIQVQVVYLGDNFRRHGEGAEKEDKEGKEAIEGRLLDRIPSWATEVQSCFGTLGIV